ncbi:MAG TPA: anion permease [Candidatus Faecalibacterium faecipullorum]|uniref:Anion permease n=1 Tax=Candidatus Faecalibacterium faecipullorum TaxID=2838578 RepID=A0A9D2MCN2_9FIRM|nr:anion permease [Candidatus Faecalibacterium faecipullorum]
MDMYIVLAITLFMMVMFIVGKVPYGVITMTCCALLAVTGVMSPTEAFSGLSNSTTLLIAGMLALATAFGKTSAVARVRSLLAKAKEKNGFIFLLSLYIIVIILSQLMGRTACISIMILFVGSMDDSEGMTASRLITAIFSVMAMWNLKFPIGLGATMASVANSFYEGIITDPALMLQPLDIIKVTIIPGLVILAYALFAWKLIPETGKVDTSNVKNVKDAAAISKKDEICITVVFFAVVVSFFFSSQLGGLMNVMPAIGVLVLLYTKSLSVKEAVSSMTTDMVWMVAGVLTVSSAIGSSGLGDVIGQMIENFLGGSHNSFLIILVFSIAATVITTFMSNTGTQALLTPIAASYCLVSGGDPRGIVLAVNIAAVFALAFPSGSGECALMFAVTGHNPIKLLRYTGPYLVLAVLALTFSINMFYPVF